MIVQHAEKAVTDVWFSRIGGDTFGDKSRVQVIPDPSRDVYAAWGVGNLTVTGLLSPKALYNLISLAISERIMNTRTGEGSWRWQNSAGFAVDGNGVVKWAHVADHAGDVTEYDSAAKALI